MDEQRSEAWYKARIGRLTGSNIGAVLGIDPNRKREDVLRAMVRETLGAEKEDQGEFVENTIFGYGKMHEDGAAIEFQMETGLSIEKCGFFPYDDWLGASPDGLTSDGGILEIKAPWSRRGNSKKKLEFKTLDEQPQYYAQMQIECLCAGRSHAWFYQWASRDDCPGPVRVERDEAWLNENLPALRQFHAEYLSELSNEDHLAPRRVTIDTPEAQKALREWDEIAEQLELLNERKADLLADITAMAKGKDALIAGRKVTLVSKAGSVSYAKVVKEKLKGLDLTPWTGKPSEYWKIT